MSDQTTPLGERPFVHLQVDDVAWRCLTPEQRDLLQQADKTLALVQDPESAGEAVVVALDSYDELHCAIVCEAIRLKVAMTLRRRQHGIAAIST